MKMLIQRHANAKPAATDFDRQLSDIGRDQAVKMQAKLTALNPDYGSPAITLSSNAQRAIDTVTTDGQRVRTMTELYPFGFTPELDAHFKRLSNAALRTYAIHDTAGDIQKWAAKAQQAIKALLTTDDLLLYEEGYVLRIGCHGVVSMALAIEILGELNPEARERLLDLVLGEACAILIHEDGRVEIIEP